MMALWRAGETRAETIEFGMRAPQDLRLDDYPLQTNRKAGDLFPWMRVEGDRNNCGATTLPYPVW